MSRRPFVPRALTRGPFTIEEALRAGLTRKQLEGHSWRRVAPRTYVWAGLPDTPTLRLTAIHRQLPLPAAFSGRTAGWVHGLDLTPCDPVEITLPRNAGISARTGVVTHRMTLPPDEIVERGGFRVTSIRRTLLDLAIRLPPAEAVVAIDAALRLGLLTMRELEVDLAARTGAKGVRSYRRAVSLADPRSESPMESRLRLLLVLEGLPQPLSQVDLHDRDGRFLARVDLYYEDARLAIEYDGATHRETLVEDNRRQNRLLGAGYTLLRFTAADVLRDPSRVLHEVRGALARRANRAA